MEAVLSYVELFIALVGETEHISLGGHCLVECRIEYNDLRNSLGNNALAGSESKRMSMVVNRSELTEFIDLINNLISNENGLIKNISALHDSVTYSRYFVHTVNYLCVACCKGFNKLHKSLGMRRERTVSTEFSAVVCLVGNVTVNSDSVAVTLSNNAFIVHVDELILE